MPECVIVCACVCVCELFIASAFAKKYEEHVCQRTHVVCGCIRA